MLVLSKVELMSFKREALLSPEDEVHLAEKMLPLWISGEKGKEIAKKLGFGIPGTILAEVKPRYIYYFRQKFNKGEYINEQGKVKNTHLKQFGGKFPVRKKPSFAQGEKRYGTRPDDLKLLSTKEFLELIDENLGYDSAYSRRSKSFLALLFFSPLRSSELTLRTISDFEINEDEGKLVIKLLRLKKKHKPTDKSEPCSVPLAYPLMNTVIEWLEGEEWKDEEKNPHNRPFNFKSGTASNIVKETLGEEYYPHYTRFRFLTLGASDPKTSIAELKAKSRLTLSALGIYIKSPKQLEDSFDRRQIERLKQEGVI